MTIQALEPQSRQLASNTKCSLISVSTSRGIPASLGAMLSLRLRQSLSDPRTKTCPCFLGQAFGKVLVLVAEAINSGTVNLAFGRGSDFLLGLYIYIYKQMYVLLASDPYIMCLRVQNLPGHIACHRHRPQPVDANAAFTLALSASLDFTNSLILSGFPCLRFSLHTSRLCSHRQYSMTS